MKNLKIKNKQKRVNLFYKWYNLLGKMINKISDKNEDIRTVKQKKSRKLLFNEELN